MTNFDPATASVQELREQSRELARLARERETPMTEADVKRLYKEGRFEEIETARKQGRLDDLLSGKTKTKGA
jgi:hypothetical protein